MQSAPVFCIRMKFRSLEKACLFQQTKRLPSARAAGGSLLTYITSDEEGK